MGRWRYVGGRVYLGISNLFFLIWEKLFLWLGEQMGIPKQHLLTLQVTFKLLSSMSKICPSVGCGDPKATSAPPPGSYSSQQLLLFGGFDSMSNKCQRLPTFCNFQTPIDPFNQLCSVGIPKQHPPPQGHILHNFYCSVGLILYFSNP